MKRVMPLYRVSQTAGLGSNPVGLDRGHLGDFNVSPLARAHSGPSDTHKKTDPVPTPPGEPIGGKGGR